MFYENLKSIFYVTHGLLGKTTITLTPGTVLTVDIYWSGSTSIITCNPEFIPKPPLNNALS